MDLDDCMMFVRRMRHAATELGVTTADSNGATLPDEAYRLAALFNAMAMKWRLTFAMESTLSLRERSDILIDAYSVVSADDDIRLRAAAERAAEVMELLDSIVGDVPDDHVFTVVRQLLAAVSVLMTAALMDDPDGMPLTMDEGEPLVLPNVEVLTSHAQALIRASLKGLDDIVR